MRGLSEDMYRVFSNTLSDYWFLHFWGYLRSNPQPGLNQENKKVILGMLFVLNQELVNIR